MIISPKELHDCLVNKFKFDEIKKTKHDALILVVDGRQVAYTQFSRSREDIRDKMFGMIARQIGVTSPDLKKMVGCTKSREEYLQSLHQSGYLS